MRPSASTFKATTCLINWHCHSIWSVHLLWNIKCFFSYWWWEDNTSWDVYHWKWNLYLWSVWTTSKSTFATHPWHQLVLHLTSVWIILMMRKLMNQTLCLLMKSSHRPGLKWYSRDKSYENRFFNIIMRSFWKSDEVLNDESFIRWMAKQLDYNTCRLRSILNSYGQDTKPWHILSEN